jgi:heme-degrading monooxygenase HmoA
MLGGSRTRARVAAERRVAVMISRIWHGYTTPEDADTYEQLLRDEIFTGIAGRNIEGFREIQLFRRPMDGEVEFVTVMWFDSLDAVRTFAGSDYELAVVPAAARSVLSRFDERSQHYEVRERRATP